MATIFLVDDDEKLTAALVRELKQVGHACQVENNGERALARLGKGPFDLLILDVMIPGLSGFEVCRRVHSDPNLYTMPILMLSAMNGREEVQHGLAQGADDYVTKPFRLDDLLRRVQRLLQANVQNVLVDELTSLSGPKHVKLEVQKLTNTRSKFALAYIELLNLTEFSRQYGNEARLKAVRHLGRGLQVCGRDIDDGLFEVGHMGGGHFVCILNPAHAEDYCLRVKDAWQRHQPQLAEALGIPADSKNAPSLDTLCCVATSDSTHHLGSHEIFEVLSHLRQNALDTLGPGVYVDRRA